MKPETLFRQKFVDVARREGFFVSVIESHTSPGFPDLYMAKRQIFIVELKVCRGSGTVKKLDFQPDQLLLYHKYEKSAAGNLLIVAYSPLEKRYPYLLGNPLFMDDITRDTEYMHFSTLPMLLDHLQHVKAKK